MKEDTVKRTVLLSLVAGLVLFVWGFISWSVLPWHIMVANKFTNEATVSQVFKDNALQAGVYYLPFNGHDNPKQMPTFVNVPPQGKTNMDALVVDLITEIISAFLVFALLGMTSGLTYWKKVGFFALTGLTIGFVSHAPYWNWFGFPTPYIGVMILDFLIGWTLAGLVVAKIETKESKK